MKRMNNNYVVALMKKGGVIECEWKVDTIFICDLPRFNNGDGHYYDGDGVNDMYIVKTVNDEVNVFDFWANTYWSKINVIDADSFDIIDAINHIVAFCVVNKMMITTSNQNSKPRAYVPYSRGDDMSYDNICVLKEKYKNDFTNFVISEGFYYGYVNGVPQYTNQRAICTVS